MSEVNFQTVTALGSSRSEIVIAAEGGDGWGLSCDLGFLRLHLIYLFSF